MRAHRSNHYAALFGALVGPGWESIGVFSKCRTTVAKDLGVFESRIEAVGIPTEAYLTRTAVSRRFLSPSVGSRDSQLLSTERTFGLVPWA